MSHALLLQLSLLFLFEPSGSMLLSPNDTLPIQIPDLQIQGLRSAIDPKLEEALNFNISKNKKWKKLISEKKLAIGVVDLSNPRKVKFARINGNEMMYAASLPKIAILLAAEDAMEKGEMEATEEIKKDLRLMISKSDNAASTRMIDRLGYQKISRVLTDPQYELYDEDYGGGLWVGKRYAKEGKRSPDPMRGISHAATVSQVCRFYYLMAFGKLVTFERSEEMLEYMVDPHIHHKFVSVLEKIAPNAKLYRKSGSWKNYHSDSILVWGPVWRRYILVAITESPDGEQIMRDLVPVVEEVLRSNK